MLWNLTKETSNINNDDEIKKEMKMKRAKKKTSTHHAKRLSLCSFAGRMKIVEKYNSTHINANFCGK